jgi:hypothetical protein
MDRNNTTNLPAADLDKRRCIHGRTEKQKCLDCDLYAEEIKLLAATSSIEWLRQKIAKRDARK